MKHDRRNTEDTRLHLRIHGAVQGVGFRFFVRQAARSLDLDGYVLNRPDGSVELEAAGSDTVVDELRAIVEKGPPHARVTRIEDLEPTAGTLPHPFEIRH